MSAAAPICEAYRSCRVAGMCAHARVYPTSSQRHVAGCAEVPGSHPSCAVWCVQVCTSQADRCTACLAAAQKQHVVREPFVPCAVIVCGEPDVSSQCAQPLEVPSFIASTRSDNAKACATQGGDIVRDPPGVKLMFPPKRLRSCRCASKELSLVSPVPAQCGSGELSPVSPIAARRRSAVAIGERTEFGGSHWTDPLNLQSSAGSCLASASFTVSSVMPSACHGSRGVSRKARRRR